MNTFALCILIVGYVSLHNVFALYNKGVVCVADKNQEPDCRTVSNARRNELRKSTLPSYDPYIPRKNVILYKCSESGCLTMNLKSIKQLMSPPDLILKSCYTQRNDDEYVCENIRFNYFKNIDKLLFLSNNIRNSTFYMVDCLVYSNVERVCHRKDSDSFHPSLVDTGNLVKPNEPNILAQDEFICEETKLKTINCDLNPYIPYGDTLKKKELVNVAGDVLLKTGTYVVSLKQICSPETTWCGYSGTLNPTRRHDQPGGKIYRCYYANKQQICKPISGDRVFDENGYSNMWMNL